MYDLIEYSYNYWKIFPNIWQYYRDDPVTNNSCFTVDLTNKDDSNSFTLKKTDQTGNDMKIDVEIMVPLKYLSNFREP